jgi:RNA polymerase-binding protein DksA
MASKKVSKKKTAKKAVRKTVVKKAVSTRASSKTAPAKKKAPAKKPAVRKKPVAKTAEPVKRKKLGAKELRLFKELLLTLRERVSGEYTTLSRDNLEANQRDPSLSDQGTDTFDREMELNMMGSEQEVLFEIDAALRRLEKGTYGVCELTGDPINIERLQALPYVRYTVRAQSELEKGRARYRPFGGTMRG